MRLGEDLAIVVGGIVTGIAILQPALQVIEIQAHSENPRFMGCLRISVSKPRPVRYAMFLDGIGPGGFQNRWSPRGLKY